MDATKNQAYIDAYYTTNQTHVKWSFWASLIALVTGLVVLIIGIALALNGSSAAVSVTTTSAGVLTQFISAGFFYLYSKNLKQLNVFYDKLIKNQDTLFAFGLVGHVPEQERASVVQAIIGSLLTRNGPSTEITPELVRAFSEAKKPNT